MKAFCNNCKKTTKHLKLKKTGFFTQCLIAGITRFSVDLREPDYQCSECGRKV